MLMLLPPRQPETAPTASRAESQPFQGVLEQEWPLLSVLHRLETQPEEPTDSAAVQVLRRMWPAQAPLVRQTLQALAAGGTGERLPAIVMETMQARLGRNFSDVRVHTSPLLQTLRAEAFTSGRNIVFAPGQLDVNTGKGLALLGHELTHVGQPLAFKQDSSTGQVFEDSQERAAHQQEESILHIVEHGWPKSRSREFQHPARSVASSAPATGAASSFVQRLAEEDTSSAQTPEAPANEPTGQSGEGSPASGQAGSPPSPGNAASPASTGAGAAAGAPKANVDALARQVYGILKNRLRAERDRRELYNF